MVISFQNNESKVMLKIELLLTRCELNMKFKLTGLSIELETSSEYILYTVNCCFSPDCPISFLLQQVVHAFPTLF